MWGPVRGVRVGELLGSMAGYGAGAGGLGGQRRTRPRVALAGAGCCAVRGPFLRLRPLLYEAMFRPSTSPAPALAMGCTRRPPAAGPAHPASRRNSGGQNATWAVVIGRGPMQPAPAQPQDSKPVSPAPPPARTERSGGRRHRTCSERIYLGRERRWLSHGPLGSQYLRAADEGCRTVWRERFVSPSKRVGRREEAKH
jgi:hypothetical protein